MRPTRMMGFLRPCSSTRLICSRILSFLAMVSDSQSANTSAQSPPCSRKASAALGGGQACPQSVDLPGDDNRRQPGDVRHDPLERARIGIDRLLLGRPRLPAGAVPGGVSGDRMLLILARFPSASGRRGVPSAAPHRAAGAAGASRAECAPFPKGFYAPRTDSGRRQDRRIDFRIASRIGQLQGSTGRYRRDCGGGGGARHDTGNILAFTLDATNAVALARHLAAHPVDAVISSLPYYCTSGSPQPPAKRAPTTST